MSKATLAVVCGAPVPPAPSKPPLSSVATVTLCLCLRANHPRVVMHFDNSVATCADDAAYSEAALDSDEDPPHVITVSEAAPISAISSARIRSS